MSNSPQPAGVTDSYASYRTIQLDNARVIVDTSTFSRPDSLQRDYEVLSWVLTDTPRLGAPAGNQSTLQFVADMYSAWVPDEPSETELTLRDATLNIPALISTSDTVGYTDLLQSFFDTYTKHHSRWASNSSDETRQRFHAATIAKDLMYQNAFVHRTEPFDVHEAYTQAYQREFSVDSLPEKSSWTMDFLTETQYDTASSFLDEEDIQRLSDYVGLIVELLARN